MAEDPRLDPVVAYCSLQGAEAGIDPGFGVPVSWDQPQLDGYTWVYPPNRSLHPGVGKFWGLFNPSLWTLIGNGGFDAIWISGYYYASAWVAILAARRFGVPILFSSEAHSLRSWAVQSKWKQGIKKLYVKRILSLASALLGLSSGALEQLKALGFSPNRMVLAPYVVDNSWWAARANEVTREGARKLWQIPESDLAILFCAKLQPWKGPQDLLEAFSRANLPKAHLIFAGDGPLRASLEKRAKELGISRRVRFLGFMNQSQLPSIYRAADLLVLPSLYEPFGLVVNEAMLCGCPVVVSDRVGAKFDLVRVGETGWVFPCGDVDALAAILCEAFTGREQLTHISEHARQRMDSWSPREYLDAFATAVLLAVSCAQAKR